ncbi:MAG: SGNH/GDSL hydrolase family protein, partial [Pirellulaceae bacterium]|nr:SGNH/GDSL hydrolase family protein [Pirellulaceae bacterium]
FTSVVVTGVVFASLVVSVADTRVDVHSSCVVSEHAVSDEPEWTTAMQKVHSRFNGEEGTFALFGDSITISRAFWFGLPYSRKNASQEMEVAFQLVNKHMLKDCWDRKGPQFGNQGSMTIRWAHKNVDMWLKDLNPEVALIMFGTNDLHQLELQEYEDKTREVVKKCLDNGTVVILSTIPPRHGYTEKAAKFADAVRKIALELKVPLTDYHAEILNRRPNDWDGALDKFKAYEGFDVPTLVARDGVHPSNPRKYRNDYSAAGLKNNGFALRNYLTLMKYAVVIRQVLEDD